MKMTFKDNEDGLTLNGSWYLAVSIVFFRPLLFQKSHFSAPSLITSHRPLIYDITLFPESINSAFDQIILLSSTFTFHAVAFSTHTQGET